MNLLSLENISKGFADKMLFQGLYLGLQAGEKVALVGANGAGKSTLMKVLMREVLPDDGRVAVRKGIRIEYLRQHPQWDQQMDIRSVMMSVDHPAVALYNQYQEAVVAEDVESMSALGDQMEKLGGWLLEDRMTELLRRFELENLVYKKWTELSGGQQRRLGLARLLFAEPDVMLLDEPTNHLDLEMVEWLEKFLAAPSITLLMITHDRYFLDAVADTIWELNDQQIYRHQGNYASFLENAVTREEISKTTRVKNQNLYRRELEWMRRQPKARTTKSRARQDAFSDLENKVSQHSQKKTMQLRTEKIKEGGKILELVNLSIHRGDKRLLADINYVFKKGDRIGLVGKNGMGKTSLLETITSALEPSSGKVIHGLNTKIGYFRQDDLVLNNDLKVIDQVKTIAEYVQLADGSEISVSSFLEEFLFDYAKQNDYVEKLSGGEKKRLQLLMVLLQHPNFLILDEPTNDLDRDTLLVLEDYLMRFEGSMILVSHDRFFLDQLVDQLWILEGQANIKVFLGNYSEYREQQKIIKEAPTASPAPTPTKNNANSSSKLTYGERLEFEKLSGALEAKEEEVKQLQKDVERYANDFEKLNPVLEKYQLAQTQLDQMLERWMELDEKNTDS